MPLGYLQTDEIFVAFYPDAVRAIEIKTGTVLWSIPDYVDNSQAELEDRRLIYIAFSKGGLDAVCVDVINGRTLFRKNLGIARGGYISRWKDRFLVTLKNDDVWKPSAYTYELTLGGKFTRLAEDVLALDDTESGYAVVRSRELQLLRPNWYGGCDALRVHVFPYRNFYEKDATEPPPESRWAKRPHGGFVATRGNRVYALHFWDLRSVSDLVCVDAETGAVLWTAQCAPTPLWWEDTKPSRQNVYLELRGSELFYVAQGPAAFLAVFDTATGKLLRRFDYTDRGN